MKYIIHKGGIVFSSKSFNNPEFSNIRRFSISKKVTLYTFYSIRLII